jgi:hypothetical protein
MAQTIYASFADPADAERAAGALLDHGVEDEHLSVVRAGSEDDLSGYTARAGDSAYDSYGKDNIRLTETGDRAPAGPAGAMSTSPSTEGYDRDRRDDDDDRSAEDIESDAKGGISTTTTADAGSGAAKGAGIGAGVGALAALAALFVPGVGLVVGGGALALALGGAALTAGAGAIAGGVTGYLKDQGVPAEHVEHYGQTVESGGALIAVQIPSNEVDYARAEEILLKYGATNINAY